MTIMEYNTKIFISKQADVLLEKMPDVHIDDLIYWFCNIHKISIGGGDIVDYLDYLKDVNKDG